MTSGEGWPRRTALPETGYPHPANRAPAAELPDAEEITADDVRYGVKMLGIRSAVKVLAERYPMRAWHPAFWVRWYLLKVYSQLQHGNTP